LYILVFLLSSFLLIIMMFFGGMVGSTAGGIKTMRWSLVLKQIIIEIRKLIHPQAIYPLRLDQKAIPVEVMINILSFTLLYILVFLLSSFLLIILGLDYFTSFGATIACMSGVGPGFGLVGPMDNYSGLHFGAKWILIADMYGGRLELVTALVFFSRSFWKK
ncbi:MAG: potassium transporter TrkG, partial [bacterium]